MTADTSPAPGDGRFVVAGDRRLPLGVACDFEPPVDFAPLDDPVASLTAALAHPVASPRLRDVAGGAGRVALVVPDTSRRCPTALLLPGLVAELTAAGVADRDITVVVACGLHRRSHEREKDALLGPELRTRLAIVDAQGQSDDIVELPPGTALDPEIPLALDRSVAAADLVVSLGVVEPHLYAGFSGGTKTVAIGCAGEATIAATHAPAFLDRPGVRVGALEGNPFQEALAVIAGHTTLSFAVNVVLDHGGRVAGLSAGDPAAVQSALVESHRDAWWRRRAGEYDVVVAGVPAPKHLGLYHASRAATYLALVARPVVVPGGLIVLCSDLPQGVGDGPGEANFGALLAAAASPAELVERGRREPLGPGGQRAYMVARVLQRYRVGVAGSGDPDLIESLGFEAYATIAEAVAATPPAAAAAGGASDRAAGDGTADAAPRVLAVADAFDTLVERARDLPHIIGNDLTGTS